MPRLNLRAFAWRFALAWEVFYVFCLLYGLLLTDMRRVIHDNLLWLLPGFDWTSAGIVIGAIDIFAWAWIWAAVLVWIYNASVLPPEQRT